MYIYYKYSEMLKNGYGYYAFNKFFDSWMFLVEYNCM